MDLTPVYAFIAVICAVFSFGLVIIDHRPIRVILLAGILGSVAIGVNLHNSTQEARIDAANQQIINVENCHSDNLDPAHVAEFCSWSTK